MRSGAQLKTPQSCRTVDVSCPGSGLVDASLWAGPFALRGRKSILLVEMYWSLSDVAQGLDQPIV